MERRSVDQNVRIIGIGGSTRSGKSTLAKRLAAEIPHSVVFHADNYWKKDKLFDETVQEYNREVPEVLDYDTLISSIILKARELPPSSTIFVEGFLLYQDQRLCDMFHKRLFLTISKRECYIRRQKTLPCTTQYFQQILWPAFIKNNANILSMEPGYITILNAGDDIDSVFGETLRWLNGEHVESQLSLHRKNLRGDMDLSRLFASFDEIGYVPDALLLDDSALSEEQFCALIASLRCRTPQPQRLRFGQGIQRSPGNLLFCSAPGRIRAYDMTKLQAEAPAIAWDLKIPEAVNCSISLIHGQPTSTLFAVSSNGFVSKILSRTGNVLWTKKLAEKTTSSSAPSLWLQASQRLIIGFHSGTLCCVSPFDGKLHWSTKVPSASDQPAQLAVSESLLYCAVNRELFSFHLQSGKLLSVNVTEERLCGIRGRDHPVNDMIAITPSGIRSLAPLTGVLSEDSVERSAVDFSAAASQIGTSFTIALSLPNIAVGSSKFYVRGESWPRDHGIEDIRSVLPFENLLLLAGQNTITAIETSTFDVFWSVPTTDFGDIRVLNSAYACAQDSLQIHATMST